MADGSVSKVVSFSSIDDNGSVNRCAASVNDCNDHSRAFFLLSVRLFASALSMLPLNVLTVKTANLLDVVFSVFRLRRLRRR